MGWKEKIAIRPVRTRGRFCNLYDFSGMFGFEYYNISWNDIILPIVFGREF